MPRRSYSYLLEGLFGDPSPAGSRYAHLLEGAFEDGDDEFRKWYAQRAGRLGLNPDPDAPEHFYDYRAAFAAGAEPDESGHWPSEFKREGHPDLYRGIIDTRTGKPREIEGGLALWETSRVGLPPVKRRITSENFMDPDVQREIDEEERRRLSNLETRVVAGLGTAGAFAARILTGPQEDHPLIEAFAPAVEESFIEPLEQTFEKGQGRFLGDLAAAGVDPHVAALADTLTDFLPDATAAALTGPGRALARAAGRAATYEAPELASTFRSLGREARVAPELPRPGSLASALEPPVPGPPLPTRPEARAVVEPPAAPTLADELMATSQSIAASPAATRRVASVIEPGTKGVVRSLWALDEANNPIGGMTFTMEPGGGFRVQDVETGMRGSGGMRAMMRKAREVAGGPYLGSFAETDEGAAALARLRLTDPDLFPNVPPGAGNLDRATTAAGREVPFRWAVVDLENVLPSHKLNLAPEPGYPKELQPRARDRAASKLQLEVLSRDLRPELLMDNPLIAHGAPLVALDPGTGKYLAISGNMRTLALKKAARDNPGSKARYISAISDAASRFGIDPDVPRYKGQPVLVRLYQGDLDRARLVRLAEEANVEAVAGMSTPEQALVDAPRIGRDVLDMWIPNDTGNLGSAANRDFVRSAVSAIGGDLGKFIDADGSLSQTGVRRLQAAMLAKAYGNPNLIEHVTETVDDAIRGLGNALTTSAPRVAKLREAVAAGELFDLDLGSDIAAAAEKMRSIRNTPKMTVERYLAQTSMLGEDLAPEARLLLEIFESEKRRPSRIAKILHRYTELAEGAGDPRQVSMFDAAAPSRMDLLRRAREEWFQAGERSLFEEEIMVPVQAGEGGYINLPTSVPSGPGILRRWFTSAGEFAALGRFAQTARALKAEAQATIRHAGKRTEYAISDFTSAFQRYQRLMEARGVKRNADSTLAYITEQLETGGDLAGVSDDLAEAARAMQAQRDELSRRYLTRGDLQTALRFAIEERMGRYRYRSHEVFRNPEWEKIVKEDPREQWRWTQFIDWAKRQHPDWADEEVVGYANRLLRRDPDAFIAVGQAGLMREGRGNLKARIRDDKVRIDQLPTDLRDLVERRQLTVNAAVDQAKERPGWLADYMASREGLPVEIENLIGLDIDPAIVHRESVSRAAHDIAIYDMHRKLRDAGAGEIFYQQATGNFSEAIGGVGPLAPYFTTPEIAAAIRASDNISTAGPKWWQVYRQVNGYIKLAKTAGNFPPGHARNAAAWPFISMLQGQYVAAFDPRRWAKSAATVLEGAPGLRPSKTMRMVRAVANTIELSDGRKLGEALSIDRNSLRKLYLEWIEDGIAGESAGGADLAHYLGVAPRTRPERVGAAVRRGVEFAINTWTGGDDLGKGLIFETTKRDRAWARFGTADLSKLSADELLEIRKEAAGIVRDTTPTASLVPPGVAALRDFPLVATYPSFWSEVIFRNLKNNLKVAGRDLLDANPRIKILGAKRLGGTIAVLGMAGGGVSGLFKLTGLGAEVAGDALRSFVAPWSRESQLLVTDNDGKGRVRYLDASALIPYAALTDSVMSFVRGIGRGEIRDGAVDAVEELLGPFLDEEITANAFLDWARNTKSRGGIVSNILDLARRHRKQRRGGPVYQEGAPAKEIAGKIAEHFYRAAAPGAALWAERMTRALDLPKVREYLPRVTDYGTVYKPMNELLAFFGLRFSETDVIRSLGSFQAPGLLRRQQDVTAWFNRKTQQVSAAGVESKRPMSRERLLELKAEAQDQYGAHAEQLIEAVQDARAMADPPGSLDGHIRKALRQSLSEDTTDAIMAGRVPRIY